MKLANLETYNTVWMKLGAVKYRESTHKFMVVVAGEYLGCQFNNRTGVNVPHFGPKGLGYLYTKEQAVAFAAAFGGESVPYVPMNIGSR